MPPVFNRLLLLAAGPVSIVAMLMLVAASAAGQSYPARPVQVTVPYQAGSNTDVVMRQLSPKMSESLGQQVLVVNQVGAAGTIGTSAVAKAAPDGYRILMGTSQQMGAAPFLFKALAYDPIRDFAPIARVGGSILALAIGGSMPIKTVAELVAHLKANAGKTNYASNGVGGTPHFAAVRFLDMAGLQVTHVPYNSPAMALTNLISTEMTFMFYPYPAMQGQVEGGLLRVIATTGTTRSASLPQVPTLHESGFQGYAAQSWIGLYAPAGTPRPIIEKLNNATVRALTDPELAKKLTDSGLTITISSPEELAQFTRSENDNYRRMVSASGIKPE